MLHCFLSSFHPSPPVLLPPVRRRIVLCSGKVFYDLHAEREKRGLDKEGSVAIVRIEQLCPFPFDLVVRELRRYPNAEVRGWFCFAFCLIGAGAGRWAWGDFGVLLALLWQWLCPARARGRCVLCCVSCGVARRYCFQWLHCVMCSFAAACHLALWPR